MLDAPQQLHHTRGCTKIANKIYIHFHIYIIKYLARKVWSALRVCARTLSELRAAAILLLQFHVLFSLAWYVECTHRTQWDYVIVCGWVGYSMNIHKVLMCRACSICPPLPSSFVCLDMCVFSYEMDFAHLYYFHKILFLLLQYLVTSNISYCPVFKYIHTKIQFLEYVFLREIGV